MRHPVHGINGVHAALRANFQFLAPGFAAIIYALLLLKKNALRA